MQDGIIKGNGNSRYLKTVSDALTLYPTYEDFMAALIAGTLPIDLNGVNTAGWDTMGTALNKASLLSDATAARYGFGADATPNDVLAAIGGVPVLPGTVFWYAAATAPVGFLICDGSVVSRTDYAALFAAIGTAFGAGDGSTTFALPDLRAKFVRGAGTSNGYSAAFGATQEATSINKGVVQDNGGYSILRILNSDKSIGNILRSYISTISGNYLTDDYVRPYNIALTPIIKY